MNDDNDRLQDGTLPEDPFDDAQPVELSVEGWDAPVALRRTVYGPPLPLDALPGSMEGAVRDMAANIQSPVDYVAGVALGVISGGVMGRYVLNVNGYRVHPNLSVLGILRSGERKSDPISRLTRPIVQAERFLAQPHNEARSSIKARRRVLEAQQKTYIRKLASKPECGLDEHVERIELELSQLQDLGPLALLADDVTPEMAASIAADNGGLLRVYGDEGPFLQHLLGRYNDSPAVELFLNGWSGARTVVHRISRDPIVVERTLLSVVAAVQPSVVQQAMSRVALVRRGGFARFVMIVPEGLTGKRTPLGKDIDVLAQDWFLDQIGQLYRTPVPRDADGRLCPVEVVLDQRAQNTFADAFVRFERRRAYGGDLESFGNIVNKFDGHLYKVALTLWAAEREADPRSDELPLGAIPGEFMERSVALMEAQIEHQLAAARAGQQDRALEHAIAIQDHVARHGTERYPDLIASERDIHRSLASRFDDPSEAKDALRLLERYGWCRMLQADAPGRGRPPTPSWQFHPRTVSP